MVEGDKLIPDTSITRRQFLAITTTAVAGLALRLCTPEPIPNGQDRVISAPGLPQGPPASRAPLLPNVGAAPPPGAPAVEETLDAASTKIPGDGVVNPAADAPKVAPSATPEQATNIPPHPTTTSSPAASPTAADSPTPISTGTSSPTAPASNTPTANSSPAAPDSPTPISTGTSSPTAPASNTPPPIDEPTARPKIETPKPPALVRPEVLPEEKWNEMTTEQRKKAISMNKWFELTKFLPNAEDPNNMFTQDQINKMHFYFVYYGAYIDNPKYNFSSLHAGPPLLFQPNQLIPLLPKQMKFIRSNWMGGNFNSFNQPNNIPGMLLDLATKGTTYITPESPDELRYADALAMVGKETASNVASDKPDYGERLSHYDALTHFQAAAITELLLMSNLPELANHRSTLEALKDSYLESYQNAG